MIYIVRGFPLSLVFLDYCDLVTWMLDPPPPGGGGFDGAISQLEYSRRIVGLSTFLILHQLCLRYLIHTRFMCLQKFEAYDSNGAVVAGDKNKEVGDLVASSMAALSFCFWWLKLCCVLEG